MENAADALKISFAVFVFVFAILVAFTVIGKAKTTSDVVLYYTDKTNFYTPKKSKDENRTVGVSQIVSTLNRIAEGETITVSVMIGTEELVPKDLGTSPEKIERFIEEIMKGTSKTQNGTVVDIRNMTFKEEFVEVNYTGQYVFGADGSELTIVPGGTREYITYYAD